VTSLYAGRRHCRSGIVFSSARTIDSPNRVHANVVFTRILVYISTRFCLFSPVFFFFLTYFFFGVTAIQYRYDRVPPCSYARHERGVFVSTRFSATTKSTVSRVRGSSTLTTDNEHNRRAADEPVVVGTITTNNTYRSLVPSRVFVRRRMTAYALTSRRRPFYATSTAWCSRRGFPSSYVRVRLLGTFARPTNRCDRVRRRAFTSTVLTTAATVFSRRGLCRTKYERALQLERINGRPQGLWPKPTNRTPSVSERGVTQGRERVAGRSRPSPPRARTAFSRPVSTAYNHRNHTQPTLTSIRVSTASRWCGPCGGTSETPVLLFVRASSVEHY